MNVGQGVDRTYIVWPSVSGVGCHFADAGLGGVVTVALKAVLFCSYIVIDLYPAGLVGTLMA